MQESIDRVLVLLKPDTVKRGIMGEIISRFEKVGFKIVAAKMKWADEKLAGQHYGEDIIKRRGEVVRNRLISYLTAGPVLAIVIEGIEAIENIRMMVGATEPKASLPGTIRGDYSHISFKRADAADKAVENILHASANQEDAEREIPLWFSEDEIYDYKTVHEAHTF